MSFVVACTLSVLQKEAYAVAIHSVKLMYIVYVIPFQMPLDGKEQLILEMIEGVHSLMATNHIVVTLL